LSADHESTMFDLEPHFAGRPGWRRIYLDMPRENTRGSDALRSNDEALDLIERFIDAIIPGRRFAVAGSSYGAYLARGLVRRRGGSIDGLLLTVPVMLYPRARRTVPRRTVLRRDERVRAAAASRNIEGLGDIAVVETEHVVASLATLSATSTADEAWFERFATPFSFDVDDLARPFEAPALFVMGRQDHVCGYRDAWSILENYPRATFAVLDRAGHLAAAEQPALFAALVREWLDRVEEWAAR
jgi:pimeloyl-ACP methyl ester carboxylesterase